MSQKATKKIAKDEVYVCKIKRIHFDMVLNLCDHHPHRSKNGNLFICTLKINLHLTALLNHRANARKTRQNVKWIQAWN